MLERFVHLHSLQVHLDIHHAIRRANPGFARNAAFFFLPSGKAFKNLDRLLLEPWPLDFDTTDEFSIWFPSIRSAKVALRTQQSMLDQMCTQNGLRHLDLDLQDSDTPVRDVLFMVPLDSQLESLIVSNCICEHPQRVYADIAKAGLKCQFEGAFHFCMRFRPPMTSESAIGSNLYLPS